MPDFDIDFCMNKRQKVIDHIINTYGQDKVSQIITYNTLLQGQLSEMLEGF